MARSKKGLPILKFVISSLEGMQRDGQLLSDEDYFIWIIKALLDMKV
jgi:hypothetical protein